MLRITILSNAIVRSNLIILVVENYLNLVDGKYHLLVKIIYIIKMGVNPFSVVKDFEDSIAKYTGAKYAVAVDSCTNAVFYVANI